MNIGIFGGSFNPVHKGHVNLAVSVKNDCDLGRVLVIPTFLPPHKPDAVVPYEHRMNMCIMAFDEFDGFEVSDIEREIGGKSYTIYTLERLTSMYPNDKFFFILGGDELLSFDKWFGFEEILEKCTILAAARSGGQNEKLIDKADKLGNVKIVNLDIKEISSSDIRERLVNKQDVSELVSDEVLRYIEENRLY